MASGISQANGLRAQARLADRNARYANEQGLDVINATRLEASRHYREASQMEGQQQATMAANGIDLTFGSAAAAVDDTRMLAREDVAQIYKGGQDKVRGLDREAASYRYSARNSRSQATGVLISSAFSAAGSALGGAQQYSALRPKIAPDTFGGIY